MKANGPTYRQVLKTTASTTTYLADVSTIENAQIIVHPSYKLKFLLNSTYLVFQDMRFKGKDPMICKWTAWPKPYPIIHHFLEVLSNYFILSPAREWFHSGPWKICKKQGFSCPSYLMTYKKNIITGEFWSLNVYYLFKSSWLTFKTRMIIFIKAKQNKSWLSDKPLLINIE